jgi:hypothetical protein
MNVKAKISRSMVGCADEEEGRYALNRAQITPAKDGVWVTTTDGRCMAFTKAQGEADEQCLMPTEILSKTSKYEHDVVLNGKWTGTLGKSNVLRTADVMEGLYPKVVPCLPTTDEADGKPVDGRPQVTDYRAVSLDTALLDNIGQALVNDEVAGITLLVPDNNELPMLVVPSSGYQGVGVLMPIASDPKATPAIERYKAIRAEIEAAYNKAAK